MLWLSLAFATPALEARAAALRAELGPAYTVLVEAPWIVVGDEAAPVVKQRAAGTVRWATQKLTERFFTKPPAALWTIWLFEDGESYRRHAKQRWNEVPSTPYGYAAHQDLVMNISTGGGTLVHEMVHPYVDANVANPPPWFNEALASLYEQCGSREGRIVGFTNWRLEGLQSAIAADEVPPFEMFMKQSREDFYDRDPGTNYSQGRYLLYYLQEKGLLDAYWKRIRAGEDGAVALRAVVGQSDLRAFQQHWQGWVMALSFP